MNQAYHEPDVPSAFGEVCAGKVRVWSDKFAHALAGPTVEQQGEMARSGGRMLATLEPEQVRTFTDSLVGFSEQNMLYILV